MPSKVDIDLHEPKTVSFTKVVDLHNVSCGENDSLAVAKSVFFPETSQSFYYVKQNNKDGSGLFFNTNTNEPSLLSALNRARGCLQFEFKKVNEECYNLYIKFLESKNEAFLRMAERSYNASNS